MEDTLRGLKSLLGSSRRMSLNPYSNGRYSERQLAAISMSGSPLCLNPYSNGRYSEREL